MSSSSQKNLRKHVETLCILINSISQINEVNTNLNDKNIEFSLLSVVRKIDQIVNYKVICCNFNIMPLTTIEDFIDDNNINLQSDETIIKRIYESSGVSVFFAFSNKQLIYVDHVTAV